MVLRRADTVVPEDFVSLFRPLTTRVLGGLLSIGVVLSMTVAVTPAALAAAAPVGQGFTVTPGDLAFILKQIKIAERHSRAFLGTDPAIPANPDPAGDPNNCQALVGPARDQIPDRLT
ncbi:MAG: hypothetical protein ABJA16_13790, partial [Nakamurella sp.]